MTHHTLEFYYYVTFPLKRAPSVFEGFLLVVMVMMVVLAEMSSTTFVGGCVRLLFLAKHLSPTSLPHEN
jgi:hypothetical protein